VYRTSLHLQFDLDPNRWIRIFVHTDDYDAEDRCFIVKSNLLDSELADVSPAYQLAVEGIQNILLRGNERDRCHDSGLRSRAPGRHRWPHLVGGVRRA
jgi:hypothetical protein